MKMEWNTPEPIVRPLGHFDLDPCASAAHPHRIAARSFTKAADGLKQPWVGRVFCNPPYGNETKLWLAKCAEHGNAIALIFARTETEMWFQHVWPKAHAVFFFKGRLRFVHDDGSAPWHGAGAPSALVAYGVDNVRTIRESNLTGQLVVLR